MKKYCVASIEDGVAALEDVNRVAAFVPVSALPENIREGDWLYMDDNGALTPDPEETERRRERNRNLFKGLLEP